jgi:hypothetical protein
MQSRKVDSNIETICGELTSLLTPKQVLSILENYTPASGSFEEEAVDSTLIIKISDRLNQRAALADVNGSKTVGNSLNSVNEIDLQGSAIMPGTYLVPFDTTQFVYSDVQLDKFFLPPFLRLDQIARLI